jgi:hypothetical protein
VDPDPYVPGNIHKMGPTHSRRPGNFSAQNPANASDTDDDVVVLEVLYLLSFLYFFFVRPATADQNPQVVEHVTPLAVEVGDPPAPRVRKAPASDAGPSTEPAPKR